MTDQPTHVIVGASLAGATAAETLRAEGFDGRVVLFGAEPVRPYERPPLSKQFLRGESTAEDAFVHEADFYRDNDIELRINTLVNEVNALAHTVTIEGGESIRYNRLLLATGARPRRLPVPGAGLRGVHYLRSMLDSEALRDAVHTATRVVVVGAGWIGSEVAASIRQLGVEVAMIDPAPFPLCGVLGPEVGAVLRDLHAEHGVSLHLGETVDSFVGETAVTGVRTGNSLVVPADVVIVGVGAEPRIELAREAGLDIDGGIAVDEFLETSRPGVFAAGDVAAALHPRLGRRVRVEHWANAKHQGVTAAKNMLGARIAYEREPYFFSDQYDFGLEYSGHASPWDRVVFRGDPATREFIAFYIADNKVVAAMNANVWGVAESLQSLIATQRRIDDSRLTNPDIAIDTLERVA